jgi:hypothetical protein
MSIEQLIISQYFIENDSMTHSTLRHKHDSESEVIPQTDPLHNSNVNNALTAIAQEVAELLKQSYPVQADESDSIESE